MKKVNIVLIMALVVMALAAAYFKFGTGLNVHAAAIREDGGIRCELTLSNGSLFDYEYLEFIMLSPDGAKIETPELAGGDMKKLSQQRLTLRINGADESECKLEIGYYVLGERRSVNVTID